MVNNARVLVIRAFVLLLVCAFAFVALSARASAAFDVLTARAVYDKSFDLENFFLKVNLRAGEFAEREIVVRGEAGEHLTARVVGLPGVSVSERAFSVGSSGEKLLKVRFNSSTLEPGVYVGSVVVSDGKEEKSVPVIFELETKDLFFDVTLEIPSEYVEIEPGERVVANVKVFDLTGFKGTGALGPTSVRLQYVLRSISGKVVSAESESVVVDRKTQFSKSLAVPNFTDEGDYVLSAVVRYRSSVGVASRVVSVRKRQALSAQPVHVPQGIVYALVSAFVFVLVVLFAFYAFFLRERRKLIAEIERHNELELKRQRELLLAQRKLAIKKGASTKEVDREIERKLTKVREEHKRRLEMAKKARARREIEEMKRKIEEWKKKGYNTLALELKLKALNKKEMERLMEEWKGKGYKNKSS
ncbi:hypothetical protein D6817_04395 [Candidatus Pacearchaeota archaeon]|nr:MAG: hypothetical protein D6817_04395 [Candidatus Pacearchaeota archaeon]